MGRVATHVLVGVAGTPETAEERLIVNRRLNGEAHALLVAPLPFGAYLLDNPRGLVPDDDRPLADPLRDALVRLPLDRRLVGGHADAVRDHPGEYFILLQGWEVELVEA